MAEQRQAAEILGENLRKYRNERGWSQEEAAEKARLSRAAYIQIEMGKSEPRSGTLLRLAESFGVKLEELFVPARKLTYVRFRAHARLNTRNETLSGVARWLDDYLMLENVLGKQLEKQLPSAVKRSKSRDWREFAEATAALTREQLGLGSSEAIRDICGLLEDRAGIKLFFTQVKADGFFGLSVGVQDGGPAIVVNTEDRVTVERQIFTAVHELGHLIMHPKAYDANALQENLQEEKEANFFAGCFLMPKGLFQKEWNEACGHAFLDRVFKVKRIFRVSYKTVLYRISETIEEKDVWERFREEYGKRFGRNLKDTEEPERIEESLLNFGAPARLEPMRLEKADFLADRFQRLVREALEKQEISRSTAADMLGITVSEVRDRQSSWDMA